MPMFIQKLDINNNCKHIYLMLSYSYCKSVKCNKIDCPIKHTTAHHSTPQHTTAHLSTQQHTTSHHSTLNHTILHHTM